jgi:uncharacterized membrane protein
MMSRAPLTLSKATNGPGDDIGELLAITGGFAFAVASCLAIRDAMVAETSVSTLVPFAGALLLVIIGITLQQLRGKRAAGS